MALYILLLLATLPSIFGVPTNVANDSPILIPENVKPIAIPDSNNSPIYRAHPLISPIVPKPYRARFNSVDYSKLQQNANASHKKIQLGAVRSESLDANSGRNLTKYHNDLQEIQSGNTKLVKANNKYLQDDSKASLQQRRLDIGQNRYSSSDIKSNRNIQEGSSSIQRVGSPIYRIRNNGQVNNPLLRGGRPSIIDEKDKDDSGGSINVGQPIPNSGEKLVDNRHIKQSVSADLIKQQQSANARLRKYQKGNVRDESSEINSKSNLDKVHSDYSRSKTGDTDVVSGNYGYTKDDRQAGSKQRRLDIGDNHFISDDRHSDRSLKEGSSGVQVINAPGFKEYKSTNRKHSEEDHHSSSFRKYVYGNKNTGSKGKSTTVAPTTNDGEDTTTSYNTNTTPDTNSFNFTTTPSSVSSGQGTTDNDQGSTDNDQPTTSSDQGTTSNDQGSTNNDQGTNSSDQGSTNTDQTKTSDQSNDEKLVDNRKIKQSISADFIKKQQSASARLRKYQKGNVRDQSSEINSKSNLDKVHSDYSRSKTGNTDVVSGNYGYTKDDRQAGSKQRRLDIGDNHFISDDRHSDRNLKEGSSGVQVINAPGFKEYKSTNRTRSEQDHHSSSFRKYVYGNKNTGSKGKSTTVAPTTNGEGDTTTDSYNTNTTPDRNMFTTPSSGSSDHGSTDNDQPTTSSDQGTTSSDQGSTNNGQGSTDNDQPTTSSDQGTTSSDQGSTSNDQGSTNNDQATTSSDQETTSSDQGSTNYDQATTSSDQESTNNDQGTTNSDQENTNNDQGTNSSDQGSTNTDQTKTSDQSNDEKLVDNRKIKQSISADFIKKQQSASARLRKYQKGNVRDQSSEINSKSNLDKVHSDYSRSKTGNTDVVSGNYGYTKDDRQAGSKQRRLDIGDNHFISDDRHSDRNLKEGSSGVQVINAPGFKEYKSTNRTRSEQDHHSSSFRKYVYGNKNTGSKGKSTTVAPTTNDGEDTTTSYNTNTTPDTNSFNFTTTPSSVSSGQGTTDNDQGSTDNDQPTTSSDQGTTSSDQGSTNNDQGSTDNDQGTTSSGQGTTSSEQGTTDSDQGSTDNDQPTTSSDQGTTSSDQGSTNNDHGSTDNDQGTTSSDQGTTGNDQGTTSSGQGSTNNDQATTSSDQDQGTTSCDDDVTNDDQRTTNNDQETSCDEDETNNDQGTTDNDQATTSSDQGSTDNDQGTTNSDQETTDNDQATTSSDQATDGTVTVTYFTTPSTTKSQKTTKQQRTTKSSEEINRTIEKSKELSIKKSSQLSIDENKSLSSSYQTSDDGSVSKQKSETIDKHLTSNQSFEKDLTVKKVIVEKGSPKHE